MDAQEYTNVTGVILKSVLEEKRYCIEALSGLWVYFVLVNEIGIMNELHCSN